jgi:hypothetical protein
MSEYSAHDGEENNKDEDDSALAYTAQKLYQQFQIGYNGCTLKKHQEQLHQHINAIVDNYYSLDDIFNNPDFPSVLVLPDMISADYLA